MMCPPRVKPMYQILWEIILNDMNFLGMLDDSEQKRQDEIDWLDWVGA